MQRLTSVTFSFCLLSILALAPASEVHAAQFHVGITIIPLKNERELHVHRFVRSERNSVETALYLAPAKQLQRPGIAARRAGAVQ